MFVKRLSYCIDAWLKGFADHPWMAGVVSMAIEGVGISLAIEEVASETPKSE